MAASCEFDDRIAFRVGRDDGDRIPVACVACPAMWMRGLGADVQCLSGCQDVVIAASVSLRRADAADGAVTVIVVYHCTKVLAPSRA